MQQKTGESSMAGKVPANMIDDVNQPLNFLEIFDAEIFPASKMDLIAYAQDQGASEEAASEEALNQLQGIPDDIYGSLSELNRHLNEMEMVEDRGDLWGSEESRDLSDDNDRAIADLKGKGRL